MVKLKKSQLYKLESNSQAKVIIDKDIEIAKLKVDVMQKDLSILSLNHAIKSKDLLELKKTVGCFEEKKKMISEKHLQVVKKITDDLDLPSKWGYDPDTGEVKHE